MNIKEKIKTLVEHVLDTEGESYEEYCQEKGEDYSHGHVFAVAQQINEEIDKTMMSSHADELEGLTIKEQREVKAEVFLRSRIMAEYEVIRFQPFRYQGNEAIALVTVECEDGEAPAKSLVLSFTKGKSEIQRASFGTIVLKIKT